MAIIKNEIPILEFDDDLEAVIMPNHEKLDLILPKKAAYVFLGESVDIFATNNDGIKVAEYQSATKIYPIYVIDYKDEKICLVQAPVGSAAATQLMDWLISLGVQQIISTGSCGALEHFNENEFLVPYKALRDEGTSYHYAKPSRFIEVNKIALKAIEKTLTKYNLPYQEVVTWSTDGFYRETKAKVEYRKQEGCQVVEMECSALAACAKMRDVVWGQILFTADTLANPDEYDARNWGFDSWEFALKLCLETLLEM